MSDDESREEETQPEPEPEEERHVPHQSHHEESAADSNEARKAMEEAKARKREKMEQELAEFEAMRKEEREKELEELEALRIKREQRKLERQKEEERLNELREIEEKRQRAEQEERKKRKAEEEQKKKEERDKKRKDAEARMAIAKSKGARNFVITKREGDGDGVDLDRVQSDEPYQKSREELEEEKRAVLAQRIQPLNMEGMNQDKLLEKARQLHEKLRSLEGDKYDLEQRFKRQQYDMIELAERARQMNKGKSKRSAVQVDESFDRLSDKYTSAPPKIQLCSKYEKLTDRRTFGQRAELFEELSKEPPPPEIKRIRPVAAGGEEGEAGGEGEGEEE